MRLYAIEWIYTLEKSMIEKAFNQPMENAISLNCKTKCVRYDCVNHFLWWAKTKEGPDFWVKITNDLIENEQHPDT